MTPVIRLHNFVDVEEDGFVFLADVPLPFGGVMEVCGLEYARAEQLLIMHDRWPKEWQAGLLQAAKDATKLRVSVEIPSGLWLDSRGRPVEIVAKSETPGADLCYHVEWPGEKAGETSDLEIRVPVADLSRPARVN